MPLSPQISDWARRLIASEGDADAHPGQTRVVALRVYEKLRQQLSAPFGIEGFQSLAVRALMMAKGKTSRLNKVRVTTDGSLRGLGEIETQKAIDEDNEGGLLLINQLLALFLTFLGEATTQRLIEDIQLQIEHKTQSREASASHLVSFPGSGTPNSNPFEDILLEADKLRHVSERIEILADKHAEMEEGLMSVAGNIRNVAAVLDIYTLIRSNVGGSQEEDPDPAINGYLN